MCTAQVFASRVLDGHCQEIGRLNLKAIGLIGGATPAIRKQPVFAYLVTKLQNSGGHSKVIEDFVKARPDAGHVVLSTELDGKSDHNHLTGRLAGHPGYRFEPAQRGNFREKLTWLQQRLVEIQPERTYLFNHHQDSVAVAAIQPEMGLDAGYYHHGDHHLCLGVYLSHLEHIDPHPMGFHNCQDNLGIKNTYFPLTVDDMGGRPEGLPFKDGGTLITCTAARSNKIEAPYFISYLDVIPEFLKATGGKHIHIGRLTPWALFRIRRGLRRNGVPRDRMVYIPWVPSVWKALHDFRVDLYIASFPYGGGLTLIEAMGAGVPVAVHNHIHSRMLGGIDLAYPEAFSWRWPDELVDYCATVSPGVLRKGGHLARIHYENFHHQKILEEHLNNPNRAIQAPAYSMAKFVPENDEWAAWMESQVSFGRLMRRGVYRFFRTVRARFF